MTIDDNELGAINISPGHRSEEQAEWSSQSWTSWSCTVGIYKDVGIWGINITWPAFETIILKSWA